MTGETIFRFFSTRPAAPLRLSRPTRVVIDPYALTEKRSVFYQQLEALTGKSTREEVAAATRTFMASEAFGARLSDFDPDISALKDWFSENRSRNAQEALLSDELSLVLEKALSPELAALSGNLADSLMALALTRAGSKHDNEGLVLAAKFLHFRFSDVAPGETETLGTFTARHVVALPAFLNELLQFTEETPPREAVTDPGAADAERAATLEKAHREISGTFRSVVFNRTLADTLAPGPSGTAEDGRMPLKRSVTADPVLSPAALAQLSTGTKNLLATLNVDASKGNPFSMLDRIEDEMLSLSATLEEPAETFLVQVGGAVLDAGKFRSAFTSAPYVSAGTVTKTLLSSCTYAAGIGDLLLVKQQLKGYRLGEIAHIENVLQGEKRERNHRRLNRVTDEFFTEEEREETRERDLETTERNEIQNEISRTAARELSLDVGVQVSGSFGPSVSFDSQVDSSFSSSVEESQRKATTFSRELTEKSSETIRERVKKERRKITLEEIEEVNQHRFENDSGGNIRGVYRWMDKLYDAQVMSYGQRMIFDFVVPEPAAFFLCALAETPPEGTKMPKPNPPMFMKRPLAPGDLTRTNYQGYVRAYHVTGAPEPPPQIVTVSHFDSQDGTNKNDYARAAKLQLPENYAAYAAWVGTDNVHPNNDDFSAHIVIGGSTADLSSWGWDHLVFSQRREKEIALAIHYRRIFNFSVAIDVFCELTVTGFTAWQNKMYEAIMEAYRLKLAEFEENAAAASVRRGSYDVLGADPACNKNITRDELRKLVLMLLTKNAVPGLDSYLSQAEPVIDPEKACANGSVIRFFENAFEWNNMAYVMYPYFWGRKARWTSAIRLAGTDTDFTAFLKAGAARVQLAVRPGFEKAVVHFIQFGEIWEGNDAPVMEDDTYLPIIQEITENLGTMEEGVPYPKNSKPWEVSVPTSLVYLQENVPVFEDPLEA